MVVTTDIIGHQLQLQLLFHMEPKTIDIVMTAGGAGSGQGPRWCSKRWCCNYAKSEQ